MQALVHWIVSNKEWLLSGIGIAVPLALLGWWLQSKSTHKRGLTRRCTRRSTTGFASLRARVSASGYL